MRVAIVKNGIVENVCEASQEWADENGAVALPEDSAVSAGHVQLLDGSFEAPALSAEARAKEILGQIAALEREQLLPRITREALMAAAVAMAAGQGVSEPMLYAANIGYRKMKDFDAMIAELRAQL